ncbi:dolichol-phosphate mannosyltransferase [Nocardioides sp. BE266]|uniref:glycosyltransferase n=1 Tax=Nocardioides sp. BE266 TaxID=2817725 RepID=UPI00285E9413|nr:glycosyltransferase [Nocardioides sp. BE266]MDR7253781.1 dolichol-phosphate mannosyltransferase [Nocardioides sp. BE266]
MISVVIPALNEAENLTVLVPRVVSTLAGLPGDWRVLVVDDGSTDDTTTVVAKLSAEDARVSLLQHRRNLGKAAALNRGFSQVLDEGADVVVMMDADGQDDPDELPRLLEALETADLVTGARLKRNDRFIKRNTSKLYNWTTGRLSGAPGRDFNSGYKVMRADVARDVVPMLYGEMHRYLTVIAHQAGYRVAEVPVQHHARMSGSSKYGPARFWRGFSDLLTVRFLMSYENRPSHLFGGFGAVCFLLGIGTLLYLTGVKLTGEAIGGRPLLLAGVLFTVVGLQLTLFGLLAELVVHARNRSTRAGG